MAMKGPILLILPQPLASPAGGGVLWIILILHFKDTPLYPIKMALGLLCLWHSIIAEMVILSYREN